MVFAVGDRAAPAEGARHWRGALFRIRVVGIAKLVAEVRLLAAHRRRQRQQEYNAERGITPETVIKAIRDMLPEAAGQGDYVTVPILRPGEKSDKPEKLLEEMRAEMLLLAEQLEFEAAAKLDASYAGNRVSYARAYGVAAQDWDTFSAQLRAALELAGAAPDETAPEAAIARTEAEALLRNATNLFE